MNRPSNLRASFCILVAGTLMAVAGVGLISPILPTVWDVFGLTDVQASALVWGYLLPGVILPPFIGYVADRWGRRRVLFVSLWVFGIFGTAGVFVNSFQILLIFRVLQGIGGIALPLMARTLIGDYYGEQTGSYMGIHDACLSLGGAVCPVLGGWLGSFAWYAPFALYSLGIPVGLGVLYVLPDWERSDSSGDQSYLRELGSLLTKPRFMVLIVSIFLVFVLKYGYMHTALPFFLSQKFTYSSSAIGYFVGGVGLAVAAVSVIHGRIENWAPKRVLIPTGFLVYGLGFIVTSLSTSPATLIAGIVLAGGGHGILLPSINTAIVTFVRRRLRASAMSLRKIFVRVGQALGSPALAYLGQTVSYDLTLISIGGGVVVLSITGVMLSSSFQS
ncbi:MAG: MFS transporter [bacterium]